jgi:esterase/lipase
MLVALNAHSSEKIISAKLEDGKIVTAEYRPAAADSPAVLVMHGFLQTRNYLTVTNIAESASEAGYAVLLPTLSLGVSERKKSLQCDAIHNHSFSSDIKEIDYWVKWLEKKGHKNITVIGHSFGSLHLLGYLMDYADPMITQYIGTSLLDVSREIDSQKQESYITDAMDRIKNNNNALGEYAVSYCKKYMAPARDYMSYASWSRKSILDSINTIKIPVTVILGAKDKRLDPNWKSDLIKHGANVIMIDEANHFFSGGQEFELLDTIQTLLK